MEEIDYRAVAEGRMDEEYVWICDYRYKNLNEKPIRHVKPQKVLVRSNGKTTKRIYYSQSHFVALNKKGLPLMSKIIPLVDNTGYRTLSGDPLRVFQTETDCRACYAEMCREIYDDLSDYYQMITSEIVARQVELSKSMQYK